MTNAATQACGSCSLPRSTVSDVPSAWQQHPHFPRQTLLLGSHRNFRRLSDYLVASAERSAAEGVATRGLFESWMAGMGSHEHYEERKLYRFLARRFGGSFDCLEEQHHTLHEARDIVRKAYADGEQAALVAALRVHRDILNKHLDHEESIVIPLLLQLEPDEFEHYCNTPIALLLAD